MMKEYERKELERMEELAAEIERNPLTKKFREDEAAVTLSKRREASGKLEALRKEQGEVIPKLREAVEDKEARYLKARAALDAANGELQTARAALSSENNSFDTDIRNQEAILYESADPRIDKGIEFFRAKLDYFRSPGRISSDRRKGERNLITDTVTVTVESNVQAIKDALLYCQAAIKSLEEMKLSPALDPEWIEELKAAIPRIDIFIETIGTKPIPGSKGINPRWLLKSDSELDWQVGKLNEKFKKLMRK